MKKLRFLGLSIVLLLVSTTIGVTIYLKSVSPVYDGVMIINDVSDTVEVRYDHYGVPHIYAENDTDAYFALGYAVARERLFQMELLRRVGSGRLAEIFGKDLVIFDNSAPRYSVSSLPE